MIRVVLRMIPLVLVAVFALAVQVLDGPVGRAREMAGLEAHQLSWAQGLVKCPNHWDNLPIDACTQGYSPIKPFPAH